jgi:hypothetical protein
VDRLQLKTRRTRHPEGLVGESAWTRAAVRGACLRKTVVKIGESESRRWKQSVVLMAGQAGRRELSSVELLPGLGTRWL